MALDIQPLSKNFVMPSRGTSGSAGYDISMCDIGYIPPQASEGIWVNLGFSAALPKDFVALLLPRSGKGTKQGLMLNNSVGVIDSDFRGQWRACLRVLNDKPLRWDVGDKLLQFVMFRAEHPELALSNELNKTDRGAGGFGHTGV